MDKRKILKCKTIDDLLDIEYEILEKLRNKYYDDILSDNDVKQKIIKLFNIPENLIDNALMINGAPPLDYDNDEDI